MTTLPLLSPGPRLEEANVHNFTEEEGTSYVYSKEYVLPLETDLELTRGFTQPGITYIVTMTATNMHNQDDSAKMTWLDEASVLI